MLLLLGPAVGGAIIGGTLAGPTAANWGFWMGLAAGAVVTAFLFYFNVLKPQPEPKRTPKRDTTARKGGYSLLLWLLAFGLGGYFIGRALGGAEVAFFGVMIGLCVSFLVGFLLVSLIRHVLKPATKEEGKVYAALDVVVMRLFFCLVFAAFVAADSEIKNQAFQSIGEGFQSFGKAVYSAADQTPVMFWIFIATGVAIGLGSGFWSIRRQALRSVSGEAAPPSGTTLAAPQKQGSNKADRASTDITEKPKPSSP